jgi:hypothetical protein
VKSEVPLGVFSVFLDFVEGEEVALSDENCVFFRRLAEEFRSERLLAKCSAFLRERRNRANNSLNTGLWNVKSPPLEVSVGSGHCVRITCKDGSRTYEALHSLSETESFLLDLENAKENEIEVDGMDGTDRIVEKAVAAVYCNTVKAFANEENKKLHLAMILWKLQKELCVFGIDGSLYCLNRLHELASTDFEKASLLLLSQCKPGSHDELIPLREADAEIVHDAIHMLREEKAGKANDAKDLLQRFKDPWSFAC